MNLRDLKYLVAVADLRHFGHAAERALFPAHPLDADPQARRLPRGYLIERTIAGVAHGDEGKIVARARVVLREADRCALLSRPAIRWVRVSPGVIPTVAPYACRACSRRSGIVPEPRYSWWRRRRSDHRGELRLGHLDAIILALPCWRKGCGRPL